MGSFSKKNSLDFERFIVSEYLKYGSVDEVFRSNCNSLPISYPGVYHILEKWKVIRSVGRNHTPFVSVISFFARLIEEKIPLRTLYNKMPKELLPSFSTLHLIYRNFKKEVKKEIAKRDLRRRGTALFISPERSPFLFLVGRDTSFPDQNLGKYYGSLTLPMTFSGISERNIVSIKRVLQQEVFSKKVIEKPGAFDKFLDFLPTDLSPFMYLDIADVRVSVYHIILPEGIAKIENFSSFRIKNFSFISFNLLKRLKKVKLLRCGVWEMAKGFRDYYLSVNKVLQPIYQESFLNLDLREMLLQGVFR